MNVCPIRAGHNSNPLSLLEIYVVEVHSIYAVVETSVLERLSEAEGCVVTRAGVQPATFALGVRRSMHLSYRATFVQSIGLGLLELPFPTET